MFTVTGRRKQFLAHQVGALQCDESQRERKGAIIVLAAGVLVMVMAFTAFTVDIGYIALTKSQMQTAADAAALGGAMKLPDASAANDAAEALAGINYPSGVAEVSLGQWNGQTFLEGATPFSAVKVTVRRSQADGNSLALFFAPVLGHETIDVSASAVASLEKPPVGMLYALDPAGDSGLEVKDGTVRVYGPVYVNSQDNGALDVDHGQLLATEVRVVGGVQGAENVKHIEPGEDSPLKTGQAPVDDPYADLPEPTASGQDYGEVAVEDGETVTLSPGMYDSLEIGEGANVTFEPGIYTIRGGKLEIDVEDNGTVTGEGVMFHLTDGAEAEIELEDGRTSLSGLDDPNSPFDGMLIYADRNSESEIEIEIDDDFTDGSTAQFTGTIYAKSAELEFDIDDDLPGNFELTWQGRIVVGSIEVDDGNLTIRDDFELTPPTRASLVE